MASQEGHGTSGLKLALATYVVVFAGKLATYFASGVMALLAEALHTLADIFVAGFLLIAAHIARRRADEDHAFGHARAENVAALVAATLFVSFTSYKLYEEAVPRLFGSQAGGQHHLGLAVGVLVASMFVAAAPLVTLLRQRSKGAAARALMVELINDQLGLVAALAGTLGILWGFPLADPLAAIVVATVIAVNAVVMFRENASFLLGCSPPHAALEDIRRIAASVRGVLGVHSLRVELVGPDAAQASLHVEVAPELSLGEADRVAAEVKLRLRAETLCRQVTVHMDPAENRCSALPGSLVPPGAARTGGGD